MGYTLVASFMYQHTKGNLLSCAGVSGVTPSTEWSGGPVAPRKHLGRVILNKPQASEESRHWRILVIMCYEERSRGVFPHYNATIPRDARHDMLHMIIPDLG